MEKILIDSKLEKVSGLVERVTFHSEETGFCVLRIKVRGNKDLVTLIGNAAVVSPGEHIEGLGEWINDRNHGLQFKAKNLSIIPPSTIEGIQKYLGSGIVKGIGPHFAKKLVKAFGDKIFDVIENFPERLTELEGIGKKRQQMVVESWDEQKAIREIMVFLQSYGLGTSRAVRIYKKYGDDAVEVVRENPYKLTTDIHGIGFKTADEFAKKLGIKEDSLMRAKAGVRYILQKHSEAGHCACRFSILMKDSQELLGISQDIIETAINAEHADENIILEDIDDELCIFLASLHTCEKSTATLLTNLNNGKVPWNFINFQKAIPWVEEKTKLKLSPTQQKAVESVLNNKVNIITGGPGVGKTTIVNSIIQIISAKKINIALCAPTGRAAKRLSETTGLQAKTIHRLLEFDAKKYAFKRDHKNPLLVDFLVVDEASMLDIVIMHSLLKAIPKHAAVLFVGDVDQLPSVGPGKVLTDIIASQVIPTQRLTEIFRQAKKSKIIVNAHRINQGSMPYIPEKNEVSDFYTIYANDADEIREKLIKVVRDRIPNLLSCNPIDDIQVLTPMNRSGLGAISLNIELQQILNKNIGPKITKYGSTYIVGDKVIQKINNYDKNVFNGDIGKITKIDEEESLVYIEFDERVLEYDFRELDEISLAYAISIHKSQGSEYPVVVIPVAMQHFMMLAKNLLYTAVTRGKKLVVLIGQKKAVAMAVKNISKSERITNLEYRLNHLLC